MTRKAFVPLLALAALSLFAFSVAGCSDSAAETAVVDFSITDAPVASDSVKEVYVTFSSLEINESSAAGEDGSGWTEVPIDATKEYELLSLTGGLSDALGSLELSGGTRINQIRFGVGSIELVETDDAADAARHPVTLSSSTGLKIVNAFDIPLSGTISIVVDFDVRKSLVYTAGQGYKMKPTLRAIVENEAGEIRGTAPAGYSVYAYASVADADIAADTFADPADTVDSPEFDDAYTSVIVGEDGLDADGLGSYTLAFMDAGSYDLVLVDPADGSVVQVASDIVVVSAQATTADIALP